MDWIYQVQVCRRGVWQPLFRFSSSQIYESKDLDEAMDYYRLNSRYDNIRLVRIETSVISQTN